ncbi:Tyrosine recombinase XerC [subsurface metagenome]
MVTATTTRTRQDLVPRDSKRQDLLPPSLSLDELVARFMASCRRASPRSGRHLAPKTLKYYQMCLDGLRYFAAREHWPEPAALTRDHLRDFMDYLDTETHRWGGDGRRCTFRKASPATVHHYLKVAATFFRWCEDEEYLEDSPARRFRLPNPQYRDVEPYTDEEVSAMLAICERDIQHGHRYLGVRNKAIIGIFIDTGLRLQELTDMKLSELDPQLQQVRILGKGNKWRTVPVNGEAKRALKLYLTQFRPPGGDEVWLTDDGAPLSLHSIRIMINRLKRRAGVTSGGSAHRFRHYFATRYLENGGDLNSLRLLLGHATLYMVLRYTRFVQVTRALDSHAAFSPLDNLTRGEKGSHRDENWGWRR